MLPIPSGDAFQYLNLSSFLDFEQNKHLIAEDFRHFVAIVKADQELKNQ